MKKMGYAAVLMLTATAIAGMPGQGLVNACLDDLQLVEEAFDSRGQTIVAAAVAKLAQLDDRGATDKKLTQEAAKFGAKLVKLETDCIKAANKTAQKCFVRLANLDEDDLIEDITEVDAARDETVGDIQDGEGNFQDAITAALQDEIAD